MPSFALRAAAGAACCAFAALAHASDPVAALGDLKSRLSAMGPAKVDGTDAVADKTVPALYFGERKINRNYDVVDGLRKASGATATVFVKSGDEFVRVSTNVLTPEGKRGIGTVLARNKAYDAVSHGQQFCGEIDVLGTHYDACYDAIKDPSGAVIGATYVGLKK